MRPTDENQHSTRPNLMSSPRRGGNEESILEMLERDTVRTRGLRAQSRFGWYVSGTVFAVFLVSLLVWLARESPEVQQMEAVLSGADADRSVPAHPPVDRLAAANRAAIVDEQAASSRTQDSQQHLPIVLATPGLFGPVAATQSPSSAGALVQDAASYPPSRPAIAGQTDEQRQAAAAPTPAQAHVSAPVSVSVPVQAPVPVAVPASMLARTRLSQGTDVEPQSPLLITQAAGAPGASASGIDSAPAAKRPNVGATRSLAATGARQTDKAPPLNGHANRRKPARTAAKPKRPLTVAANIDTLADSDVALISAVIQHATKRPDPAYADPDCAAKARPKP